MSDLKRNLPNVVAVKHGDYGLPNLNMVIRVVRNVRRTHTNFNYRMRPSGMNTVRFKPSYVE